MFRNINSLTKKIKNHIFFYQVHINNSNNCYFIFRNNNRYFTYWNTNYSNNTNNTTNTTNTNNTNNTDLIKKKIDFDTNIHKINFNQYITEQDQSFLFENDQFVYEFIINIKNKLNLNYITDFYLLNKNHIKMKLRKRDLYIYKQHLHDEIYSDKIINYIYFIYKKTISVNIEGNNYKIYCIYYLHDHYSFDDFSQIKYTCLYIYFDIKNNSFLIHNK